MRPTDNKPNLYAPAKKRSKGPYVSHNTGPKGVIADYNKAKERMVEKMEQDRIKQQQAIRAQALTVDDHVSDEDDEFLDDDLENDEIFKAIRFVAFIPQVPFLIGIRRQEI